MNQSINSNQKNISIHLFFLKVSMSIFPTVSVCPSVFLKVASIHLSACISFYLSAFLKVSICLPVYPSQYQSICLSVHLSVFLKVSLFLKVLVFLSGSIHLTIHQLIRPINIFPKTFKVGFVKPTFKTKLTSIFFFCQKSTDT